MKIGRTLRFLLFAGDEICRSVWVGITRSRRGRTRLGPSYFIARNNSGSVEHYYHFTLGMLLPLVIYIRRIPIRSDSPVLSVRSCGPFDLVLREVLGDSIQIMNRFEHRCRELVSRRILRKKSAVVEGFDDPAAYDAALLLEGTSAIRSFIAEEIEREYRVAKARFDRLGLKVLIINRERSPDYYQSKSAEIKGSGAERRSIANMDHLADAVRRVQPNVLVTSLEGLSLASQIALFEAADVIIAQHGAALVNLIWARTETQVIEIIPPVMLPKVLGRDFFGDLARCLGQGYTWVLQDGEHGDAPIADIVAALPASD